MGNKKPDSVSTYSLEHKPREMNFTLEAEIFYTKNVVFNSTYCDIEVTYFFKNAYFSFSVI